MAEVTIPSMPVATYRLQFRNGMTFDRAIRLIPHWKSLGISHLYASPIFTAVTGSTHGYDVTNPNELDPALGGADAFFRLSDRLRAEGLGLILDIVPNHMAASLETPQWRSLLKWGHRSPSARFFDNDWSQPVTLPVLAEPLGEALRAGNAKIAWSAHTRELVLDYRGSAYPIDPSTYSSAFRAGRAPEALDERAAGATPDHTAALEEMLAEFFEKTPSGDVLVSQENDIAAIVERQPWRMIHWRDAANGLSYRRFFEITGLVGVRVEDPAVFEATHKMVLDLVAEGRVQGLRIDHIDGLADPLAYLKRLRQAVGPEFYIVVEKILEGDETLPADWPVQGTTGYEFIADLAALLCPEDDRLDRAWRDVAPDLGEPEQALARAKRLMVEVNFAGEVEGLTRQAEAIARSDGRVDLSGSRLLEAVRAVVAGFEVYRTYAAADALSAQDAGVLEALFDRLKQTDEDAGNAIAFLEDVLAGRVGNDTREAAAQFRTRLQHLTGPVLAKSIEDTFFYRYNRLIALNEVGGEAFDRATGIGHFHARMSLRERTQPHGLTTTATHDTKRGEDARARLYAIGEAPDVWIALTRRWSAALSGHCTELPDGPAPEPAVQWLLFQALAGMLPATFDPVRASDRDAILDRFLPYVEKALREAKLRTNWSDVNEAYERAVKDYAAAAIGSTSFLTSFWRDIRPFVRTGEVNGLTQTVLKLTVPGVPDIYQGAEHADLSLVDPDNRRVPDFDHLVVSPSEPPPDSFDQTKAWLIRTVLRLRRQHANLFAEGRYLGLRTGGLRSANVISFARRSDAGMMIVVAPCLVHAAVASGMFRERAYWGDTFVELPAGTVSVRDALGGEDPPNPGERLLVAELFQRRSVALLFAGT